MKKSPNIKGRLLMVLCYMNVLFIVPLLFVKENDEFGSYHVRHGFAIFTLTIVGNIFWLILDIPAQGMISPYAGPIFNLLMAVASVYGIVTVLRGRTTPIWGVSYLLVKGRV